VGIGTVSRVLNRSPLVSDDTRRRVLAAIERLGYEPSPIARAFGRRRTDKLEVLIPLFAHGFVLEILRGIQDALVDTDYTLLIRTAEDARERERLYQECCGRGRAVAALVVWMAATEQLVERVQAASFPAVLINAVDPRLWSVGVDHDSAAERAVGYCIGLGHRTIGLVDRREDPFDPRSRGICQRGYERALTQAGYAVQVDHNQLADPSAAAGAAALEALLALPERPTAIVAGSEAQAIGVLGATREMGRRVPDDLCLVGYNETPVTRDLGLTTVQLPLRELGRVGTETLLTALAEPGLPPEALRLPTELVVRRTSGPPRYPSSA
jgi:LacI family transcriptional regulator/LacI family repressor for deo operon, udp, cdd, tsx, nupC, and nupG